MYYGFTARVWEQCQHVSEPVLPVYKRVRGAVKHVLHLWKLHVQCIHKADGCTLHALPFHKHPGLIPSETFVLWLEREEVRCDFELLFKIFLVTQQMRGWEYVETCFASLYHLCSFWMSTLVSMTDVGDETGVRSRIKFMLIAESCKLWMDWLRCCKYCPAGLLGGFGFLRMCSFSSSFIFSSLHCIFLTLTLRERLSLPFELLADPAPASAFIPVRFVLSWHN